MASLINLFTGETLIPVLIVAVVSFLAGLLVELALCKCACSCHAAGKKAPARPAPARARCCSERAERKPAPKAAGEERFEKRHPAPADGSIEVYVGNLSYDMTEDQLREAFAAYGTVNAARIVTNRHNGKSKGFGFVQMPNRPEVEAAVKALNDTELLGRKIKCNEAKNVI